MTDAPSIGWAISKAYPGIKSLLFSLRIKNIIFSTQTWTKTHAHVDIHTHNTYSPAKESPQRGAVHTVFTALLNYWLVVFLLLWEATPYEQGERLAHKNCSRILSLEPDRALLTSASLLNRTLAFPLHRLARSAASSFCFPSLSLICLIYSHILSLFLSPSQTSPDRGAFINWTADCAQQKSHISHWFALNY